MCHFLQKNAKNAKIAKFGKNGQKSEIFGGFGFDLYFYVKVFTLMLVRYI